MFRTNFTIFFSVLPLLRHWSLSALSILFAFHYGVSENSVIDIRAIMFSIIFESSFHYHVLGSLLIDIGAF